MPTTSMILQPTFRNYFVQGPVVHAPPIMWTPRKIDPKQSVDEQAGCAFLRLPSEIRNEIYILVFSARRADLQRLHRKEKRDVGVKGRMSSGSGDVVVVPVDEIGARNIAQAGIASYRPFTCFSIGSTTKKQEGKNQEPPAHPLAFLATCRKISLEATALAFSTHTFTTSKLRTYYDIRWYSQHLLSDQLSALTRLAYDTADVHWLSSHNASEFIANSIACFPSVKYIEVREKSRPATYGREAGGIPSTIQHADTPDFPCWYDGDEQLSLSAKDKEAVRTLVPSGMRIALSYVVSGTPLRWPKGEQWRIVWPQLNTLKEYPGGPLEDKDEWDVECRPRKAMRGYDARHGIALCECDNHHASWLRAHLVQETGRKVTVDMVYYDAEESDLRVKLVPTEGNIGQRLPVRKMHGGRGIAWDGEKSWWSNVWKK